MSFFQQLRMKWFEFIKYDPWVVRTRIVCKNPEYFSIQHYKLGSFGLMPSWVQIDYECSNDSAEVTRGQAVRRLKRWLEIQQQCQLGVVSVYEDRIK